jgi:hypothetical protein
MPGQGSIDVYVPIPDRSPLPFTSYRIFFSGSTDNSGQRGVGFAVAGNLIESVLEWRPISDRVAYLRIDTKPVATSLITAYAPTNAADDIDKDEFYDALGAAMVNIPAGDVLMVLGDFNAQLGKRVAGEEDIIGLHSLNRRTAAGNNQCRTDNGERMASFVGHNNLVVANSLFRHKRRHLETWLSADKVTRNQIDFFLVKRRWRSTVHGCRAYWAHCLKSDHAMLVGTCRLKLATKHRPPKPRRIPAEQFHRPDVQHTFQLRLHNRFAALTNDNATVDDLWSSTKHIVLEEAQKCVGKTKRPKNDRMSRNTMDLIQQRKPLVRPDQFEQSKELKLRIKESEALDEEVYWSAQADEMNKATRNGDTGKLFKIIKRACGKSSAISEVIKERNGDVITNQRRRVERWAEHFNDLLNRPPPPAERPDEDFDCYLKIIDCIPSIEEVKQAVKQLRSGSAAGEDGIPPELWKVGGYALLVQLTVLMQLIWSSKKIPDDWYLSIILPLYKKADKAVCGNHRGISLLDTAYKLLEIIILNRIRPKFEKIARENQCGFRPGRGTVDQILALRLLIEERQEHRQPLIVGFVDFSAAFDSVDRPRMFTILQEAGIPYKVVEMIRLLYRDCSSRVRVYNTESDTFPVSTGVKQGAILSPVLFNIVLDAVLKQSMEEDLGVKVFSPLADKSITDMDYADDIALVSDNAVNMQSLMDRLSNHAARVGLQISVGKTKMCHRNCPQPAITLNGNVLEVVEDFTYLGSRIDMNGSSVKDISTRIAKASSTFNLMAHRLWNNNDVSLPTKLKVYYAAIRPVLTYACDTWAPLVADLARFQAFELRCWRRMLHVSYLDRVRNDEIIARIRPKSMVADDVKRKRLTLLGHVLRMGTERLPKACLMSKPPWKRPIGGVRTTWIRQIYKDLTPLHIHYAYQKDSNKNGSIAWLVELEGIAEDRHEWRVMVDRAMVAGVT